MNDGSPSGWMTSQRIWRVDVSMTSVTNSRPGSSER